MSLQARMLAGLGIIAGLLVAAGLLILNIQQGYLVSQLDERMGRQIVNATAAASDGTLAQGEAGQPRRARGMADLYLGLLTPSGLTTLDTPATDPGLTPVLDSTDRAPVAGHGPCDRWRG